jgi:ribosomal RNA-processing protein 7
MLTLTQGYLTHHRLQYPDKTQLLESVNAFMTAFAAQEASQVRLQTKRRQVPDEDGFITVTKGGRNGPARQEAAQELVEKQRKKHKGLEDFYRFQTREKRKAKAGELLRKFEEDKEKIRRMREKRTKIKVMAALCL